MQVAVTAVAAVAAAAADAGADKPTNNKPNEAADRWIRDGPKGAKEQTKRERDADGGRRCRLTRMLRIRGEAQRRPQSIFYQSKCAAMPKK